MAWGARFGSGCFGGVLSLLVGFALLPSGCSSESTNNVIGQPDAGQPDTGQPDTGQPDTGQPDTNDAGSGTCSDGVKNGSEVAVDCGGGCLCSTGQPCQLAGDCASSVCAGGKCQPPNCTDGYKNGDESDIDCGGNACPACAALKACVVPADCTSHVCKGGVCQTPTCSDLAQNADETDIDCGGSTCGACADGKACVAPSDCVNGLCASGKCVPASCLDGVLNGDETDKDCGGSCAACNDGQICGAGADCKSLVCSSGTCQIASCNDTAKNALETDVDCGGPICPKCAAPLACAQASDCQSAICLGNKCQAASCTDSVKNGAESDVDCGGNLCSGCLNGQTCSAGADCKSGGCASAISQCGPWAKRFGDTTEEYAHTVAVDSQGNIILVGEFSGSVSFGGATFTALGTYPDAFVVKLSPSGAHLWSKQFGGTGIELAYGVAVDASDDIVVVGGADSTNFGGGLLTSKGSVDAFIVKLKGSDGSHIWSTLVGGLIAEYAQSVAVVPSTGDVVVVGRAYSASYSLGGATFTGKGGMDAFVAKYKGSDGSHLWSKGFGDTGEERLGRVAVDSAGNAFVAGSFTTSIDLGGGSLPTAGSLDMIVGKLDSTNGAHLWSKRFGGTGFDALSGIAVDPAGDPVITGSMATAIDLGGGLLPYVAQSDVVIAKFNGLNGSHLWSVAAGGGSFDLGNSVAFFGSDPIVTGSYLSGALNFGGGNLPAGSGDALFMVRLTGATGAHVASAGYAPTTGKLLQRGLAISPVSNSVVISGSVTGTASIGTSLLIAVGGSDAFVASFGPLP